MKVHTTDASSMSTTSTMSTVACGCTSRPSGPRCCAQETATLRMEVSHLRADLKQALARVEDERRAARGARLAAAALQARVDAAANRADALETRVAKAEQRARIAERKVHTTEEARRIAERALRAADLAASTHHSRLQRNLAASSASSTPEKKKRISSNYFGTTSRQDDRIIPCSRCYTRGRHALLRVFAVVALRISNARKIEDNTRFEKLDSSSTILTNNAVDDDNTHSYLTAERASNETTFLDNRYCDDGNESDHARMLAGDLDSKQKQTSGEKDKTGGHSDDVMIIDDDVTSALSDLVDDQHDDDDNGGVSEVVTPTSTRQCRFVTAADGNRSLTLWCGDGLTAALSDANHLAHPFHGLTVVTISPSSSAQSFINQ